METGNGGRFSSQTSKKFVQVVKISMRVPYRELLMI
ncbi:hypothetical protein FHT91_005767 [Rhizobium sp. BK347]|nr:hypothetical protein [Rhizobium sp. BK252]MBB3405529.1 hypothetical protein [Rhizobium sp. BK289]MBB3417968.1 hypothetical protein [Rhizobium sp. BK284]MBB3485955.1 hypothetical protein [Rhizobium sp. BK347]